MSDETKWDRAAAEARLVHLEERRHQLSPHLFVTASDLRHAFALLREREEEIAEISATIRAETQRLRDELARAKADTERLEWLETWLRENRYRYDMVLQSDEEDGVWFACFCRVDQGLHATALDDNSTKSLTVRQAIDAARGKP